MKLSTFVLLPLAVSAATLPLRETATSNQVTPVRRAPPPAQTSTAAGGWLPSLSQVGNLINSAYSTYNTWTNNYNDLTAKLQGMVPDLLYAGVNGVSWYMSWAAKPAQVDRVSPVIDPKAEKKIIRYGPFTLLGSKYNKTSTGITMDDKSDILIRTLKGIPSNAALLSGRLDTVFADGSKADIAKGVYIHHLLVADVGKTSAPFALCPGGHNQKKFVPWLSSHIIESIGAGLIQAGNDQVASPTIYASPNGPMKSAFLTGWDDTFLLEAEIVNYNPENTTIYLALETEYLPEAPEDYLDASTLIFSATGCNSPGYKPPGNNPIYNFTSDLFTMNRDGYLLNMRGHLHDGGVSMQMFLGDELVCESFPKYEDMPGARKPDGSAWQTITEMSYCDKPVQFRKGENVKLVSNYDTTKHPLRQNAGGEAGHGGAHEGMDMAEEMGIFTVNIASKRVPRTQPPKNAPVPLSVPPPAANAPKPAGGAAPAPAAAPAKPMGGHSHGGRKMIRSPTYGMIEMPEVAYPVSS